MEVAERLGPSLDYWLDAPWAFALWTYYQLEELDRRRQWVARVERLEAAELMNLAVNKPEGLNGERAKILALAAGQPSSLSIAALIERGERMARFIRKGQVLVS